MAPREAIPATLVDVTAGRVRNWILQGSLHPGQRLSEEACSEKLAVSRNTLREAFRVLAHEGLIRHERNRGVFVVRPGLDSVLEIFRVRRFLECPAVCAGVRGHPAIDAMRQAHQRAVQAAAAQHWVVAAMAIADLHRAVVALADSPRLEKMCSDVFLELTLAYSMLDDPGTLLEPIIESDLGLLDLIKRGHFAAAADWLTASLDRSERAMLAAYGRLQARDVSTFQPGPIGSGPTDPVSSSPFGVRRSPLSALCALQSAGMRL